VAHATIRVTEIAVLVAGSYFEFGRPAREASAAYSVRDSDFNKLPYCFSSTPAIFRKAPATPRQQSIRQLNSRNFPRVVLSSRFSPRMAYVSLSLMKGKTSHFNRFLTFGACHGAGDLWIEVRHGRNFLG
jgi:hypothetical protein